MTQTIEDMARIAYNAYGVEAKWLTFDGRVMPAWGAIGEPARRRWRVAVEAVIRTVPGAVIREVEPS